MDPVGRDLRDEYALLADPNFHLLYSLASAAVIAKPALNYARLAYETWTTPDSSYLQKVFTHYSRSTVAFHACVTGLMIGSLTIYVILRSVNRRNPPVRH